jgi:DNA-binding transcriptional LysR family regulator
MDRLEELAALVAILDTGSLAAAGRRLRRSPPAMTRILTGLEERMGTQLVVRTTRRLAPTETGRRLAEHARGLLAGYEGAMGELTGARVSGVLHVTAPLVFGRRHVTPIVTSFLELHPAMRVELALADRLLNLVEEGLDVAVRFGRLADSGLLARRVGEVRRVVVASPAYLARRGAPRLPAELARHDLVFTTGPLEWRFGPGAGKPVRLTPRLLVNDVDAMLAAVRAGRGIGRALSYQVADDLASGALVRLLPDLEPPALPVQLVTRVRHPAPRVRAFVDHAARALAALEVIHTPA